jgi:hypothetical protein
MRLWRNFALVLFAVTLVGIAIFLCETVMADGGFYTTESAVELLAPSAFVKGYPMLVTVKYTNRDFHYPGDGGFPVMQSLQDLASQHVGGSGIRFLFVSTNGREQEVGGAGLYVDKGPGLRIRPLNVPPDLPPSRSVWLYPGENVTTTVDLKRLASSHNPDDPPAWSKLPEAGEWRMKAYTDARPSQSDWVTVDVREPTEAEALIASQIASIVPTGRSWFPDIVLSDTPLPATAELPHVSRTILELIAVLRAAVQSPAEGLSAIDDREEYEWGYLQHLITMVEYECALTEKAEGRAEVARQRALGEATGAAELKLADDGDGLISRIRKTEQ